MHQQKHSVDVRSYKAFIYVCGNIITHYTFRCRDYVRVIRPGFGITESCGRVISEDNQNQLELGVLIFIEPITRLIIGLLN